jgi:hypothetical protein
MTKKDRPSVEQYRDLLLGLERTLKESRGMFNVFDKLDNGLHLRRPVWNQFYGASWTLRRFIDRLEYLIRNVVKEAYQHHPKVFQEQCGELVRELQKLVDEG